MNRELYKAACYVRLVKLARASRLIQESMNMEKEARTWGQWADQMLVPGGYYRQKNLIPGTTIPNGRGPVGGGAPQRTWSQWAAQKKRNVVNGAVRAGKWTANMLSNLAQDSVPGGYYRRKGLIPGTNIPVSRG